MTGHKDIFTYYMLLKKTARLQKATFTRIKRNPKEFYCLKCIFIRRCEIIDRCMKLNNCTHSKYIYVIKEVSDIQKYR